MTNPLIFAMILLQTDVRIRLPDESSMGSGCWYTTPLAVSVHNFEADRRRFIHTESMLVRSNIQRSLVLCVFFLRLSAFLFSKEVGRVAQTTL